MIAYYVITTVLVLINLAILVFSMGRQRVSVNFTFMALLMVAANAAYLSVSVASTVSEAVLATKIIYVSGCFLPPTTLFTLCIICNYQTPRWLRSVLFAYSVFVYGMVLTIGSSGLYYKDISLGKFYNAVVLKHSYGIGHKFFYVILYGYIAAELLLLCYSLKKNRSVSRKTLYALILMEFINIVLFVGARFTNSDIEVMPVIYVVDGWLLLYLHRRVMLYNVDDCIASLYEKQKTYGYIILDYNENYLGSNPVAQNVFPEIRDCRVDSEIKNIRGEVEILLCWLHDYTERGKNEFGYEKGDLHYFCTIERIWHKKKMCGYVIEMREDTDRWNYHKLLVSYNTELEAQVEEKTKSIVNMQMQVLLGIASMVESRDGSTGEHIKRTSDVVNILLETIQEHNLLSLDSSLCEALIQAAPMHDLGKISISDQILKKPGKLTEEEFSVMQTHTSEGASLVKNILKEVEEEFFVSVAVNVANYHHEKWNGTGYPEHLKGEEIPIEARLMAVADVYDALVSKRCYKEAMSFEQAAEIMRDSMGSHFDPQLAQVFELARERLEEYYKQCEMSDET